MRLSPWKWSKDGHGAASLKNGMLFVLAWVAWVACLRGYVLVWVGWAVCLRGWRASVGGVLAWVACLCGWFGWRAGVSSVGGVLTWVTCYYFCYCYY